MNVLVYSGGCQSRLDLAEFLNARGLTGTAVEVGVWRGYFSFPFLRRWRGKRMVLVDAWCKLPDSEYRDIRNEHYDPNDYQIVKTKCDRIGDRVRMYQGLSVNAAGDTPDDSLDFVYIDANHAYEYVYADLRAWYPKVRIGGVLAGHDIFTQSCPDVTSAVVEFCLEYKLVCDLTLGDYVGDKLVNASSWFLIKP
jgi:hypothetical protein